jgi:hypothetical protein
MSFAMDRRSMMMVVELTLAYRSTPRVGAGRLDVAVAIVLSTWLTIS